MKRKIVGVRNDNGYLSVRFRWAGEMRTEYLKLPDSKENRKVAEKLMERVRGEIITKSFDYAKTFPNSRYIKITPAHDLTLAAFAKLWLSEQSRITRETLYDYDRMIALHILPYPLAAMLVKDIDEGDVNAWVLELRAGSGAKLSSRRLNMVIERLKVLFLAAARRKGADGRRLIDESPAQFLEAFRVPTPEVRPFTLEETHALIDAADGWFKSFLTLLLMTGMRPGEAIALRWSEVDFKTNRIKICRTARKFGVGLPKTKQSERFVQMDDTVRRAMLAQRLIEGFKELCFPSPVRGSGIRYPGAVTRRDWVKVTTKAGVEHREIYQCRHTFATNSLASGENPYFVKNQLGHSSVELLFKVYGREANNPQSRGSLTKAFKETGETAEQHDETKENISLHVSTDGLPKASGTDGKNS